MQKLKAFTLFVFLVLKRNLNLRARMTFFKIVASHVNVSYRNFLSLILEKGNENAVNAKIALLILLKLWIWKLFLRSDWTSDPGGYFIWVGAGEFFLNKVERFYVGISSPRSRRS